MTPRGYEIRLAGQLDAGWSEWFAGFVLHGEGDGTTTLTGAGIDQAALHGALRRVADLGVTLISVRPIGDDPSNDLYRNARESYTGDMSTITVTDARANFSELILRSHTEAVFVERHGRTEAVVISPEQYERMMDALEDAEDARAFDSAMAEEGENIPWAQAKADLGWE